MINNSRRQFLRASASACLSVLVTTLSPGKNAFGQTTPDLPKADLSSQINAWPPTDVPRKSTLVLKYGPHNQIFNPLSLSYNHQNGNAILYEPCAFYNPLDDKLILWLAESYRYNSTATVLTITFRRDIKWSDGTPFTAEDVAWTISKHLAVEGLARSGNIRTNVLSAAATDNRTLQITLKKTDWRFFQNCLTFRFDLGDDSVILPKHIFSVAADDQLATFDFYDMAKQWPVSTGAYGVGTTNDNGTNFDLRPDWWAVQTGFFSTYPEVLRLQSIPQNGNSSEIVQNFSNNTIDQSIDLGMVDLNLALSQNPYLTTWTGRQNPYGSIDWWPISVYFNNMKPPFDDSRVRWAIAYALDQQMIVDDVYNGATSVTGHPFPIFTKLMPYIDSIDDLLAIYNVLEHNLAKTNQLMSQAGFHKDPQGYWADAENNRLNADLYAAIPMFDGIAQMIVFQLRVAGFDCTHRYGTNVWADLANGTAPLFLFGHGGATYDPIDTFNLYRPENIRPIGEESWSNLSRWANVSFTAIADQMQLTAPGNAAMMTLFHDGMEIWLQNLPDCPVIQWTHHIPYNTKYWENWPRKTNPYMAPALWHLGMQQVVINLKRAHRVFLPIMQK